MRVCLYSITYLNLSKMNLNDLKSTLECAKDESIHQAKTNVDRMLRQSAYPEMTKHYLEIKDVLCNEINARNSLNAEKVTPKQKREQFTY